MAPLFAVSVYGLLGCLWVAWIMRYTEVPVDTPKMRLFVIVSWPVGVIELVQQAVPVLWAMVRFDIAMKLVVLALRLLPEKDQKIGYAAAIQIWIEDMRGES